MFTFLKNPGCLSLRYPKKSGFLLRVIGGSEISKALAETGTERSPWLGRGCHWGATLYVLAMALVFGGTAGNWFDPQHAGGGIALRILQLSTGAVAMGLAVAVPGSLLFGRNPIRWGMGMPILVYLGGAGLALLAGRSGVAGLLLGSPLLLGFSIASGVMGAFLVDGMFTRARRA